jgi:hypothetical protein
MSKEKRYVLGWTAIGDEVKVYKNIGEAARECCIFGVETSDTKENAIKVFMDRVNKENQQNQQ